MTVRASSESLQAHSMELPSRKLRIQHGTFFPASSPCTATGWGRGNSRYLGLGCVFVEEEIVGGFLLNKRSRVGERTDLQDALV